MKKLGWVGAWLCVVLPLQVFAGYAVEDCPVDYTNAPNEPCGDTYGNAQNSEFSNAMQGTVMVGPEEHQFMAAVVPRKMQDRLYIRAHGGLLGRFSAMGLKLKSTIPNDPTIIPPLTKKSVSGKLMHRGAALGYQWTSAALEVEGLTTSKVKYKSQQIAPNQDLGLKGTLQNTGLLVNGLYFFEENKSFIPWLKYQPYVLAGVGYGKITGKVTVTQFTTGALIKELQTSKKGLAYGAGVGVRGRFSEHLMINTAVRLHGWPNVTMGPFQDFVVKSKRVVSAAWYLGLDFMF